MEVDRRELLGRLPKVDRAAAPPVPRKAAARTLAQLTVAPADDVDDARARESEGEVPGRDRRRIEIPRQRPVGELVEGLRGRGPREQRRAFEPAVEEVARAVVGHACREDDVGAPCVGRNARTVRAARRRGAATGGARLDPSAAVARLEAGGEQVPYPRQQRSRQDDPPRPIAGGEDEPGRPSSSSRSAYPPPSLHAQTSDLGPGRAASA